MNTADCATTLFQHILQSRSGRTSLSVHAISRIFLSATLLLGQAAGWVHYSSHLASDCCCLDICKPSISKKSECGNRCCDNHNTAGKLEPHDHSIVSHQRVSKQEPIRDRSNDDKPSGEHSHDDCHNCQIVASFRWSLSFCDPTLSSQFNLPEGVWIACHTVDYDFDRWPAHLGRGPPCPIQDMA